MAQERIGRYRILEEIASGTQGSVYRAFDPDENRLVAIKVLHLSLTGDLSYLERFRREARLAASIDHPNVVHIFDVGEAAGRHYIALEFLPENVARLVESGGLPVEGAAEIAAGIAEGLGAAHDLGIVHRDIKPQNVLITPDGTPKVTDFGIARAESLATMTATGAVMGTPNYMSPEQARGERTDARSDVYALGCVLYEMLTGEVPFRADTPLAVLRQQIEARPRPIRRLRAEVPHALVSVVERAMEKDPARRYANGAEMASALHQAVPSHAAIPSVERPGTRPPVVPPPREQRELPIRRARFGRRAARLLSLTATLIGIAVIALLAMAVIENGSGEDPTPTRVAPEVPTVVVEKPVRDRKIVQTVIVKKRVVVAPTPMPLPPKPPPPLGPVVIEIATAFDITAIGIDSGHPPFYVGVASGDLNNDGVDDLIVGASQADPGGKSRAGQTYVLFGPVLGGAAGAVQRCRHHHQRHRRRRFLGNRRRKRGHQ